METISHIALAYAIAGTFVGLIVSGMDKVNFNIRGKTVAYPRLAAGIVAGVVWPAMVWQMLFKR